MYNIWPLIYVNYVHINFKNILIEIPAVYVDVKQKWEVENSMQIKIIKLLCKNIKVRGMLSMSIINEGHLVPITIQRSPSSMQKDTD